MITFRDQLSARQNAPRCRFLIEGAGLSERASAFILAYCNQHHCTPEEAMRQILVTSANGAGFRSESSAEGAGKLAMQA